MHEEEYDEIEKWRSWMTYLIVEPPFPIIAPHTLLGTISLTWLDFWSPSFSSSAFNQDNYTCNNISVKQDLTENAKNFMFSWKCRHWQPTKLCYWAKRVALKWETWETYLIQYLRENKMKSGQYLAYCPTYQYDPIRSSWKVLMVPRKLNSCIWLRLKFADGCTTFTYNWSGCCIWYEEPDAGCDAAHVVWAEVGADGGESVVVRRMEVNGNDRWTWWWSAQSAPARTALSAWPTPYAFAPLSHTDYIITYRSLAFTKNCIPYHTK